jgi:hypothetical protein
MSTALTRVTNHSLVAILIRSSNGSLWLLALTFFVCLLGRAMGQVATQLPGMEGTVSASVNGEHSGLVGAPLSTDVAYEWMAPLVITGEGRARAQTFGGLRPLAVADSEIGVSLEAPQPAEPGASAGANLIYYMRINENRTPPIAFQPRLRILVKTRGEVTAEASAGAYARGFSSVQFGFMERYFEARADTREGTSFDSFNEQFILDTLFPGATVRIALNAFAGSAGGRTVGAHSSSVTAVVDPEFSFDEIAFAEYAMQEGFAPFRQADYYEFQFSEGVLVPEPPSIVLAAMSLVFFVAWQRKSCARLNRRAA